MSGPTGGSADPGGCDTPEEVARQPVPPEERQRGSGRALVVLPTYKESENIRNIVPEILNSDRHVDVLVVDDASPDETGELADEIAEREDRVRVLHRSGKLGLGSAYLTGFQWGLDRGYRWLLEMDADFSHDPEFLPDLLEAVQEADVVAGSRYLEGVNVVNWPMPRLLLSYYANKYARWVTGCRSPTPPAGSSASAARCSRPSTSRASPPRATPSRSR